MTGHDHGFTGTQGIPFGLSLQHFTDPDAIANCRAEYYWLIHEAFRKEKVAIAIPPDSPVLDRLAEEFAKSYYEETPNGRIKMEPKKKTKDRLKRSPNLADATVLAFMEQLDQGDYVAPIAATISARREYR